MLKDWEIKILTQLLVSAQEESDQIFADVQEYTGIEENELKRKMKQMKQSGLITGVFFDDTLPHNLGLNTEGTEYAKYFLEIDELVSQGREVIASYGHIEGVTYCKIADMLDYPKFNGWKTSVEEFLRNKYGLDSKYYINFSKNVFSASVSHVVSGIEILEKSKHHIDDVNQAIKSDEVSTFNAGGDVYVNSPGSNVKNTGNYSNNSPNAKQVTEDEKKDYWKEIIVGVIIILLADLIWQFLTN